MPKTDPPHPLAGQATRGMPGNLKAIAGALANASRTSGHGAWRSPWYFPSLAEYAVLLEQGGLEVTYAVLFERPTPLEREQAMRQ
jgi:hypothetical protein